MNKLHVYSEIGTLKKVLLHEPGEELNNLTPKYLEELLFDDIPWLKLAKEEHRAFAGALRDNGVEVVYLVDLMVDVLKNKKVRLEFIDKFIEEASISSHTLKDVVRKYLDNIKDNRELVLKCIAGIKRTELIGSKKRTLQDYVVSSPFVTNPMPNLYFTRDPFVILNDGVIINKMYSKTRQRETIFGDFIFRYHEDYKDVIKYYSRYNEYNIEGGDVLVLKEDTIIIGISQRTSPAAIETLAKNIFFNNESKIKKILAFNIPSERTFMHLDTVFCQVDYDKFTIHKGVYKVMEIYEITPNEKTKNKLIVKKLNNKLDEVLSNVLGKKITFIPCGGDDIISSDREQWSDGSNCFCIAPGVVIAYERNDITNQVLRDNGIRVITIPSSELSRGRGGPRCMTMPFYRE